MKLSIRSNREQGWHQAVAYNADGTEHSASSQYQGEDGKSQALAACQFFQTEGKWPEEAIEEEEITLCETCGRALAITKKANAT